MPKGGKATVRAGNKRGASQPPQSQPTPKAPRRVSALDLALQFGLYAVQNEKMQNVAELAETCLNQIPIGDDDKFTFETYVQVAQFFIMLCAFFRFFLVGENLFETGKSSSQNDDESDSDGEASGAEAATATPPPRLLSGNGAQDLHWMIMRMDEYSTKLFARSKGEMTEAEKNTLLSALGNVQQWTELKDAMQLLRAEAPEFYTLPSSQLKHKDNKIVIVETTEKLTKIITNATRQGMIMPNTNGMTALLKPQVQTFFYRFKGDFSFLDFSFLD